MRTIVVLDARPGMVLRAPVAGQDGGELLPAARILTETDLEVLNASGATEIEIEDLLTLPARALFPPHIEAAALQALNALILVQPGPEAPLHAPALEKLRTALDELIDAAGPELDGVADFSGPDTLQGHDYVHPVKVAEIAIVIARALGMPAARVRDLALAGALMNVGYAALRRSLLDEPRALEEHEWRHHVSMHPDYSCRILAESGVSPETLVAIEQHHERWDGSGYPRGLKGAEINDFARIIAIADTYVSLRSRRAYRNAVSHAEAIELLNDGSAELFDPDLVRVFVDVSARLMPRANNVGSAAAPPAPDTVSEAPARTPGSEPASPAGLRQPREADEREHASRAERPIASAPPRAAARTAAPVQVARIVAAGEAATRQSRMSARAMTARRRLALRRRRSLWTPEFYLGSVA